MTTQTNGNNLMLQGRLVWCSGDLFAGRAKTDFNTKAPLFQADGVTPKVEWGLGLAIAKTLDAAGQPVGEYKKIWDALHMEAFTLFPNGQIPPQFAMKFKDGDGIDDKGKSFADREGYAGHIVLACTTMIPIKYFVYEGGNNVLVNHGVKVGDYVNIQLNIKAHPAVGQGKAGLYVNPSAVQLIQAGKEIINTPSGDQLFGQVAPAYNGQVVADTAPPMQQQLPPAQQQQVAPPAQQQLPPQQQQQLPPQQAAPNYGVLPPQHQGQAQQQLPPQQQQAPAGNYQAPPVQQQQQVAAPNGLPPMPGMPQG